MLVGPVRPSRVSIREEPSFTPLFVLTYLLTCEPLAGQPDNQTSVQGAQIPPVVGPARPSILPFRKQAYYDSLLLADTWYCGPQCTRPGPDGHPLAGWSLPIRDASEDCCVRDTA